MNTGGAWRVCDRELLSVSAQSPETRGWTTYHSSRFAAFVVESGSWCVDLNGGLMLEVTAFALFAALLGADAAAAQTMTVTSPDIAPGARIVDEQVFNAFGCTGGNISPALSWSGAPKDTKSFALSVYDPDAPTGSGFWHWFVFNIPPDVASLPKGAGDPKGAGAPKGAVQSRTDFGVPGYGGPCPTKGDAHHYHFTIFAVDTPKLEGDENTTAAVVGFMLHFHTLAKAELIGVWGH